MKLCSAATSTVHIKTVASEVEKNALFYILKKNNMKGKDEKF